MKKDAKAAARSEGPLPSAMQIQLARLFGSGSKNAGREMQSAAGWRKTLRAVLKEMHRYIAANVDTDELHREMLLSGLAASDESLENEDFWPGYAEGITRLALILLGDYPDHRKRKPGRNKDGHYNLNACRSGQWVQTPQQRFRTLMQAGRVGFPQLSIPPERRARRIPQAAWLQARSLRFHGMVSAPVPEGLHALVPLNAQVRRKLQTAESTEVF